MRIIANDNALGAGLAIYAIDGLKLKTVAIIDDRTVYGQGVAEVVTLEGHWHETSWG